MLDLVTGFFFKLVNTPQEDKAPISLMCTQRQQLRAYVQSLQTGLSIKQLPFLYFMFDFYFWTPSMHTLEQSFLVLLLWQEGVVLVHCNAGVSRSSSVVIGYLMQTEALSFEDAYDQVKLARPSIHPNRGFHQQLQSYKPQGRWSFAICCSSQWALQRFS